jgi:glycerate-2-kinase
MIGAADPFDATAAARALQNHDSYTYLAAHDQLLEAMPTGTNLGDIAIFLTAGALYEE